MGICIFFLIFDFKYEEIVVEVDSGLECSVCKMVFRGPRMKGVYQSHFETIHQRRSPACIICGRVFNNENDRKNHQLSCPNFVKPKPPSQHICHHCQRSFDTAKDGVYCPVCGRLFRGQHHKNTFRVHYRTVHLKIRNYSCLYCDMKFTQGYTEVENSVTCNICRRAFYGYQRKNHFKIHYRSVHLRIKEHGCVWCGKLFALQDAVQCNICSRVFRGSLSVGRQSLERHLKHVHLKIKDIPSIYILQPVPPPNLIHPKDVVQCHICFKTYRGLDRRRSLRRHIKSKHDGVKDQVCQFCGQKFGRKYTLDTHVARRHAEQLEALSSHRNSEVDADQ
ncbi:hypothetical protein ACHWQZ_G005929 [Mnemiopsis leidyi]